MSSKKYRPYLTLTEINYLIECIKLRRDHISLDLLRYLEKYSSDIQAGLRTPNHTLQPTITQKLGFEETPTSQDGGRDIGTLLNIFNVNNSYIGMTPAEIISLKEYRFENSLMSAEEEDSYVAQLMNAGNN